MNPYDSPLRSPIVVPKSIPPFPTKNQEGSVLSTVGGPIGFRF